MLLLLGHCLLVLWRHVHVLALNVLLLGWRRIVDHALSQSLLANHGAKVGRGTLQEWHGHGLVRMLHLVGCHLHVLRKMLDLAICWHKHLSVL